MERDGGDLEGIGDSGHANDCLEREDRPYVRTDLRDRGTFGRRHEVLDRERGHLGEVAQRRFAPATSLTSGRAFPRSAQRIGRDHF